MKGTKRMAKPKAGTPATQATGPTTPVEKIWAEHRIDVDENGAELLYVDRVLLDETAYNCLDDLERKGLPVRSPEKAFMVCSHLLPTVLSPSYRVA